VVVGALGIAAAPILGATAPIVGAIAASGMVGYWAARRRKSIEFKEKAMLRRQQQFAKNTPDEFLDKKKDILALRADMEKEQNPENKKLMEAAYQKAARQLGERQFEARTAQYAERGLAVSSEMLAGKLTATLERFEKAETPEARAKLLVSLRARLGYTQNKMRAGEVNYGIAADTLTNQLNLAQTIGRMSVHLASEDPKIKEAVERTLDLALDGQVATDKSQAVTQRVERYHDYLQSRIGKAERREMHKAGIRGAKIAAMFSGAGYVIAHEIIGHLPESFKGGLTAGAAPTTPNAPHLPELPQELNPRIHLVQHRNNVWNLIESDAHESLQGLKSGERDVVIDSLLNRFRSMSPEQLKAIGFKFPPDETNVEKILNTIHPGDKLDFSQVFNQSDVNEILGRLHEPQLSAEDGIGSSTAAEAVVATPSTEEVIPPPPTETLSPSVRPHHGDLSDRSISSSLRGGSVMEAAARTRSLDQILHDAPTQQEYLRAMDEVRKEVDANIPEGHDGNNWLNIHGQPMWKLVQTQETLHRLQFSRYQSYYGNGYIIGSSIDQEQLKGMKEILDETITLAQQMQERTGVAWHSNETVQDYLVRSHVIDDRLHEVDSFEGGVGSIGEGGWSQNIAENVRNSISEISSGSQADEFAKTRFHEFATRYYDQQSSPSDGEAKAMLYDAREMKDSLNTLHNKFPEMKEYQSRNEQIDGIIAKLERQAGEGAGASSSKVEADLTPSPFEKLTSVQVNDILHTPLSEEENTEVMRSMAQEVNRLFETNGPVQGAGDYGEGIGEKSADWNELKSKTLDEILRARIPESKIVNGEIVPPQDDIGLHSYKNLAKIRAELLPRLEYKSGLPAYGPRTLEEYIRDAHILIERGPEFQSKS
jgi:hypothetical protein